MSSVFTDFIRLLASGQELDLSTWEKLRKALRQALVFEMKKRSVWSASPRYLGIYGSDRWDAEAIEELTLACYSYTFLDRLQSLANKLDVLENLDGLVFVNIRHFLHDTQRFHDPFGFRVFEIARAAVSKLTQEKVLAVLGGDPKIANTTVLGFRAGNGVTQLQAVDLREQVTSWNDRLMPELALSWHRGQVVDVLAALLCRLPEDGVEVFWFRGLVEPLKSDARDRWQALLAELTGETGIEEGDDALAEIVRVVGPDTSFEERQSLQSLFDCMAESIGALPGKRRTRDYLERLLLFLRDFATGAERPEILDRFPSDHLLGKLLGVPRGRIGELKKTLSSLLVPCFETTHGKVPVRRSQPRTSSRMAMGNTRDVMDYEDRWENLRLLTVQVTARLAESRCFKTEGVGQVLRYGDVYALAGSQVEWLALEQDPGQPQRWRCLPVDDQAMLGSRDVAVSFDGRDARVRCGCGVWMNAVRLAPRLRTARLGEEDLGRVRLKQTEIGSGEVRATVFQRETDGDPDYEQWRSECEPPVEVRRVGRPAKGREGFRHQERRLLYLAASLFLAASLGLGGELIRQRSKQHETNDIGQVNAPFVWFQPGESVRGAEPLEVSAEAELLVLQFEVVDPTLAYTDLRLVITDAWTNREVWQGEGFELMQGSVLSAVVPCEHFATGEYRLRIYASISDGESLIDEYYLNLLFR